MIKILTTLAIIANILTFSCSGGKERNNPMPTALKDVDLGRLQGSQGCTTNLS